jgi:DNA primase small subunit
VVKRAFRAYYFNHFRLIEELDRMGQREFGYKPFESGMVRHLSYRNKGDLVATVIRNVPMDLYCSNAFYGYPTYPMHEKEWLGAALTVIGRICISHVRPLILILYVPVVVL